MMWIFDSIPKKRVRYEFLVCLRRELSPTPLYIFLLLLKKLPLLLWHVDPPVVVVVVVTHTRTPPK